MEGVPTRKAISVEFGMVTEFRRPRAFRLNRDRRFLFSRTQLVSAVVVATVGGEDGISYWRHRKSLPSHRRGREVRRALGQSGQAACGHSYR
jgi:hypothetical protein